MLVTRTAMHAAHAIYARLGFTRAPDLDEHGEGATLLGSGEPRIGAHGTPILFLHPKDMGGMLVELMETPRGGAH